MLLQSAPLITTSKPWRTVILYSFLALFVLGIGAVLAYNYKYKGDPVPQSIAVGFAVLIVATFALILWWIYRLEVLEVYADRLEIKSMFGFYQKTIFKNDMTGWTEQDVSGKKQMKRHHLLTLFTGVGSYKIHSFHYANYEELKTYLTEGLTRDTQKEAALQRKKELLIGYVCLVIGAILLSGWGYNYLHRNDVITQEQTVVVQGPAMEKPQFKKTKKRKHREHYMSFGLANYPGQTFSLKGTSFRTAAVAEFVSNVEAGDTLFIVTSPSELERLKSADPGIDLYRSITIYGLCDKGHRYLSLDDYNLEAQRESGQLMWAFGIGSLVLAAIGGWLVFLRGRKVE